MKTKFFNSFILSFVAFFLVSNSYSQDLGALFSGASSAKQVCFTDAFGYVWSITGTSTGGGNYNLSGSVAVTGLGNWAISGSGNSISKTINMTATNPNGDNCQTASDNFTYTGSVTGSSISGNWANDCGLSGTFSGNYVAGTCAGTVTSTGIQIGSPASPKGDIFNLLASAAKQVCFTDGFGYVWSITGTSTGGGNYNLSGSVDVTGLGIWAISGSGNSISKSINMTATNPNGDNCQTASDNFTYTGSVTGSSISGNWVNDCGLSGTFSGTYVAGTCAAVVSTVIRYGGPANAKGDLYSILASAAKQVCFMDGFGYVWSITGTSTGGGNYNLSGSVEVTGLGTWVISGSGNSIAKTIDMTATNPNGDNCQTASDNFTYTGSVSGSSISGNWANDCGLSGTFSGTYVAGTCNAVVSNVIRYGGPANAKANNISVNPNPVVNYASITYTTSKTGQVTVSVVDNFGQVVKVLYNGTQQTGSHTVNWDATNVSGMHVGNGIYMLHVQTSSGTQVYGISVGK